MPPPPPLVVEIRQIRVLGCRRGLALDSKAGLSRQAVNYRLAPPLGRCSAWNERGMATEAVACRLASRLHLLHLLKLWIASRLPGEVKCPRARRQCAAETRRGGSGCELGCPARVPSRLPLPLPCRMCSTFAAGLPAALADCGGPGAAG